MNKSMTWEEIKNDLKVDTIVEGIVTRHESFGVFVDLGYSFEGLIEMVHFIVTPGAGPERYPDIGTRISVIVFGFRDHGHQIAVGLPQSLFTQRRRRFKDNA